MHLYKVEKPYSDYEIEIKTKIIKFMIANIDFSCVIYCCVLIFLIETFLEQKIWYKNIGIFRI